MDKHAKYSESIIKSIKLLIAEAGLNQTSFAEKLGWSKQSMSDFLSGRSLPRVSTLIEVSEALNVPVIQLLGAAAIPSAESVQAKLSTAALLLSDAEAALLLQLAEKMLLSRPEAKSQAK